MDPTTQPAGDADREAAQEIVNTWGASSSKAELVEHLARGIASARAAGRTWAEAEILRLRKKCGEV